MAGVMETAIWLASGFRPAATAGGFLNQRPATDNGAGLSLTSARRPTTAQGFFELAPGDADSLGAKKFTFLAGNQRNARALAVCAPALALIIGELLRTPTATQPRCLRWLTAPIIAKPAGDVEP